MPDITMGAPQATLDDAALDAFLEAEQEFVKYQGSGEHEEGKDDHIR